MEELLKEKESTRTEIGWPYGDSISWEKQAFKKNEDQAKRVHEVDIRFRVDKDIEEAEEFIENEMDLDELDEVKG